MFGFSVTVAAVVLTIVLAAIALTYLLIGWLRKRSWRVMLRGVGFILIPIGLLAMGLMHKVIDALNALTSWANSTFMTSWIMFGLIIACLGLAAYLVGSFVPHVSGEEAASRRQAMSERRLATLRANAAAPANAAPATPKPAKPAAAPTAVDAEAPVVPATPVAPGPVPVAMSDEDKEVDEILRRHGIS